jgi:short-subunit dehydrogenase
MSIDIYSSYARIVAMAVNEMIGADRKDMFALRYGPWAVVTGASDGIGRSFAAAIAKSGLNLVIVARREDALRDLAERLRHDYRVAVTAIVADLSSSEESARIERETRDLDVGLLIAAAGFGVSGPFVDNDIYVELNMIDVNCRALAQLTHAFARRFATRKSGGIILMSSLVAFQGVPLAANYAATKAYVQTLAEGLHDELRPLGVDVLASAPGPVKSGFGHRGHAYRRRADPGRSGRGLAEGTRPTNDGTPRLSCEGARSIFEAPAARRPCEDNGEGNGRIDRS